MTGLVLVITGSWQSDVAGVSVTNLAFSKGLGHAAGGTIAHYWIAIFCVHYYFRLVLLR